MKGSEILERFEKAKKIVAERGWQLGESGDYLRSNGYDIESNGFNVCWFSERDIKLSYRANNCGSPWHIAKRVYISGCEIPLGEVEPDRDYEVPPNLSRIEMLEKGLIKPKAFEVFRIGGGAPDRFHGRFNTFEEADQQARRLCQEDIDRFNKDRDFRPYTPWGVKNYEILAKERGELRHYRSYCYEGHEVWFAVKDVEED